MKSFLFSAASYLRRHCPGPSPLALPLAVMIAAAGTGFAAVTGNIEPLAIEIDSSANLFPSSAAVVDWVKDATPNTDTPSLIDSVATGIIPGVTGAQGGRGHWYGVRIVDGIAGNDQDIFLTGGKENDLSTWNVGPGTVGSSKYDITQAYLANNNQKLFLAWSGEEIMARRRSILSLTACLRTPRIRSFLLAALVMCCSPLK